MSCYLVFTGCASYAQDKEPTGLYDIEGLPENILPEDLEEEAEGKEKKEPTYKKPDICGEIVFDPTTLEVPITLEEALAIVLDRNFDIKIYIAKKNQDKWKYYQTITNWLPDITFEYSLARTSGTFVVGDVLIDRVNESPTKINFYLKYNLNIRKYFELKEALYTFDSAKKELEFTKDEALLEAAKGYYELLRAKYDIEILKINLQQIKEQIEISAQSIQAGAGTKFDFMRAVAEYDNAYQRLLKSKKTYRLAQAQLANTLGVPVFIQFVPAEKDIFVKEIFGDCFTLEKANEYAIYNRDDLAAKRFDIEAARQKKNAGYSIYVPEVNLKGELADEGTLQQGVFPAKRITLLVTWDGLKSLGFKGYTTIMERKAALQEQQLLYITNARDAQQKIVQAFTDSIITRQLIESTFSELESASRTRELSLIRFKEGMGQFLDVLQTQAVYTEARLDNLQSITGFNVAQVQLLFEMGVISVENILCGFNSGTCTPNYNGEKMRKFNERIRQELEQAGKYEEYSELHEKVHEGADKEEGRLQEEFNEKPEKE